MDAKNFEDIFICIICQEEGKELFLCPQCLKPFCKDCLNVI